MTSKRSDTPNAPPSAADARAAHDLNQPLTALMLYLQAAAKIAERHVPPVSADLVSLIQKALRETDRATTLAGRLFESRDRQQDRPENL